VGFLFFVVLIFAYGLISKKIERFNITGPMVFATAGLIFFVAGITSTELLPAREIVLVIGETTLVLVLFADASRINLQFLRGNASLPTRLLGIGLPLTILSGTLIGAILLPGLNLLEAAILAVILAPTDAGLGQAVVNDPRLPVRIRQALNIESGLNDGISVPFLMLFIALLTAEETHNHLYWVQFTVQQIGVGALVGILLGLAGAWLLKQALRRGWVSAAFKELCLLALAVLTYLLAGSLGGNGFIAAFAAGITTGFIFQDIDRSSLGFVEAGSELLNLAVFFILGVLTTSFLPLLNIQVILYAVLSLTLIRMLPVAISLLGTHLHPVSILLMGWFGPRGLASIVLTLVFIEESAAVPNSKYIALIVFTTVFLSVFAHGISAGPWIERYTRLLEKWGPGIPETRTVAELPTRKPASAAKIIDQPTAPPGISP
jgi:NhaP-type Na+/H+ or K+/H+ antiporter